MSTRCTLALIPCSDGAGEVVDVGPGVTRVGECYPGNAVTRAVHAKGIVRYERRKQDYTSPVPREIGVLISQGSASRHEGSIADHTAAPYGLREPCPLYGEPFRTVPYTPGLGSSAESDIGDLSRLRRDSLRLEKAWVLGVYPTCGTCSALKAAQSQRQCHETAPAARFAERGHSRDGFVAKFRIGTNEFIT